MQATPALPKIEVSRRLLTALMVAPLAALLLGGATGYAIKQSTTGVTESATTAASPAAAPPPSSATNDVPARPDHPGLQP